MHECENIQINIWKCWCYQQRGRLDLLLKWIENYISVFILCIREIHDYFAVENTKKNVCFSTSIHAILCRVTRVSIICWKIFTANDLTVELLPRCSHNTCLFGSRTLLTVLMALILNKYLKCYEIYPSDVLLLHNFIRVIFCVHKMWEQLLFAAGAATGSCTYTGKCVVAE